MEPHVRTWLLYLLRIAVHPERGARGDRRIRCVSERMHGLRPSASTERCRSVTAPREDDRSISDARRQQVIHDGAGLSPRRVPGPAPLCPSLASPVPHRALGHRSVWPRGGDGATEALAALATSWWRKDTLRAPSPVDVSTYLDASTWLSQATVLPTPWAGV